MKLKVTMAAGALRTPSWLHMALAVFCLCLPVPAGAAGADAPEWQKFCEAVPDTNCVTWIQVSAQNGSSAVISIVEPTRNSPQKMLRIVAHFEGAPPPQNGAAQVIVDAKPFADVPFARCAGADCLGEKQISAADVATLESAKSFVVQAATVQVSSPIGNLAAARAGRGKTFAEVKAEGERLIQELQKRADEARETLKRGGEDKFLADAPAARMPEGFCSTLKRIMADVPNDFQSIESVHSGSYVPVRISLPAGGQCVVDRGTPSYICTTSFKLRGVADKQMTGLAQAIAKCLPDRKRENTADSDGFPAIGFSAKKTKIDVRVTLGKTAGGGGFDVVVWVDR